MATDPQTLLDASSCFDCYGSPGFWQLMKLSLLRQIVLSNDPMADVSPQALLSAASCYACHSPGDWQLMELALLAQISASAAASAGSGSVVFFAAGGDPNGTVAGKGTGSIAYDAIGNVWEKTDGVDGTSGWEKIISV